MSEDETIKGYIQRVDELLSNMKGLGATIKESKVVKKVLLQ